MLEVLKPDEKIIVHRGVSDPICPLAETNQIVAYQSKGGYQECIVDLYCGVINREGKVRIKLITEALSLRIKRYGESNALIPNTTSLVKIGDWWAHVTKIEDTKIALLGRPNKTRLGPQYTIPFPHLTSTTQWIRALQALHKCEEASESIRDDRKRKYPRIAEEFSTIGSGCGGPFSHSTEWITQC